MTIGVVSSHLLTFRGQRGKERVRKWGKEGYREDERRGGASEKEGEEWMNKRRAAMDQTWVEALPNFGSDA